MDSRALLASLVTLTGAGGVVCGYLFIGSIYLLFIDDSIAATILTGLSGAVIIAGIRWRWPQLKLGRTLSISAAVSRQNRPDALRWVALILIGAITAFLAGQSSGVLLYQLAESPAFDQSIANRAASSPLLVLILALGVAPLAEEMLLRGLIYPFLRQRFTVLVSTGVTTLIFGSIHGNIIQFVAVLPLSVLLCIVYERTGRVWPAVLLHALFNLAAQLTPQWLKLILSIPPVTATTLLLFVISIAVLSRAFTRRAQLQRRTETGLRQSAGG